VSEVQGEGNVFSVVSLRYSVREMCSVLFV